MVNAFKIIPIDYRNAIDSAREKSISLSQERQDREKEKAFLTQKLDNIESELVNANQLHIDKEEEITMRYLEKETKFMQEMQDLKASAEKSQKEVEVRER